MRKILILLIFASTLKADLQISASISKNKISLNESLQLSITISGESREIPSPQVPALSDFRIVSSGQSRSISIVNGKITSSLTFNYVLYPKKTGVFTIPPFQLKHNGKVYSTQPFTVSVEVSASQSVPQAPSQEAPAVFIRQSVDKEKVYFGEQITYKFELWSRVPFFSNPEFHPPSFEGFFSEELPPERRYSAASNGVNYNVVEVRYALFAQRTGQIVIDPATLIVAIDDFSGDDFFGDSFFRSFFSHGNRETLKTNSIVVEILPLPSPQPGFTNAVGKFSIIASVDKTEVSQGDPVTLEVKIDGEGDFRPIELPPLKLNNFRIYETVVSQDLKKESYRIKGSKIFKTVLIPTISGRLLINPISFSFFDPDEAKYKTISTSPIYLNVLPSVSQKPSSVPLSVVREDIKYISLSKGRLFKTPLFERKGFWPAAFAPVFFWGFLFIFSFVKSRFFPPSPQRQKRKVVEQLLKEARYWQRKGNDLEVYKRIEEISRLIELKNCEDVVLRAKKFVYSSEKKGNATADLEKVIKAAGKLLIFIFLFSQSIFASHFDDACELYKKGKYEEAVKLWEKSLNEEGMYEGTYYNLGNAYWRLDKTGLARFYWEKSLKINPANRDSSYNISLVRESLKEEENKTLPDLAVEFFAGIFSLNGLILLTVASGWVFVSFLGLYVLKKRERYLWVSGFLFFVLAFWFFISLASIKRFNLEEGVVIKSASLYSNPDLTSPSVGEVSEGSKVKIVDETKDWFLIKFGEGDFWCPSRFIYKVSF